MPDVAVVIGNYEGERVLPDCLESLARQTLPPVEVIVADAGSRDASREVAAAHGARVIRTGNVGLGHLYNRGAQAASAELVLLANNDVAFDERCLELLAAELEADDRRFAADPTQVAWSDGRLVHGRVTLRRGPLLRQPLPGFRLDLTAPADGVVPTVTAGGGAMLVRRDRLLALGGFDETFYLDFEDIDLCWRAWLRGWHSVYVPAARVRHHVGAVTTARELPARIASSHHNLVRFALKCFPARAAARVVGGELLRWPRHPLPIGRALARVARELPEILRLRARLEPDAELLAWILRGQPGPPPAR
jgi:N-acetylglucosaminyl-diphospho-decaprenol L-rhamnosyltransferase